MPLLFRYISELLEELYSIRTRHPPYLPKDIESRTCGAITDWFRKHRGLLNDSNAEALLSTLLPERRTDRQYGLKEKRLEKLVGRILCLPYQRRIDLGRYCEPGVGDFADCVERVQKQADIATPMPGTEVTVEEVDTILSVVASANPFSSSTLRSDTVEQRNEDPLGLLSSIFLRLQAKESKWLVRLVLKNYAPIAVPEYHVYRSYHPLLPLFLKVQNTLPAALRLLAEWRSSSISSTDILKLTKPQVGTKVGRQPFFKARSIKHCVEMAQNRRMSIEKKYDGEYCQVHIDMTREPFHRIQIFSKSGRDSSLDRIKIHQAISNCLKIDETTCPVKKHCILEGELLVYDDRLRRVSSFHKIRKHVTRSGTYIGTRDDSPRHAKEHLMIIFFDVLMYDDNHVLSMHQCNRRQLLKSLVTCVPGHAEVAESRIISFSSGNAAKELRAIFAECIRRNEEGLIAKPCDEPYFSFDGGSSLRSCCIKLKKEYIGSFGDVGDFAVVGASYDAVAAKESNIQNLKWTHYWIACLENGEGVQRWNELPRFVVIAIIQPCTEILRLLHRYGTPGPVRPEDNECFEMRVADGISQGRKLAIAFTNPPIFDMRCFAFDKPGNTGFWTMRFPQASKVHFDRSFLDTVTFAKLQEMATEAQLHFTNCSDHEDSKWIKRLQDSDPRGNAVDASTQSQTPTGRHLERQDFRSPSTGYISDCENIDKGVAAGTSAGRKRSLSHTSDCSQRPAKARQASLTKSSGASHFQINNSKPGQGSTAMTKSSDCFDGFGDGRRSHPLSDITKTYNCPSRGEQRLPVAISPRERLPRASQHSSVQSIKSSGPSPTSAWITAKADSSKAYPIPADFAGPSRNSDSPLAPQLGHMTVDARYPSTISEDTTSADGGFTVGNLSTSAVCCHRAELCTFAFCTFCLAPCIASNPWVIEDLIGCHGRPSTTNLARWFDPTQFPLYCITTGKRLRRIFFVESNRKSATVDTVKRLAVVVSKHRKEINDLVEIYDYRLLECALKLERRGNMVPGHWWRRYWVGAL